MAMTFSISPQVLAAPAWRRLCVLGRAGRSCCQTSPPRWSPWPRGERARRQERLQRAEATFDPVPFDSDAARAYGRVYAAVLVTGRKARGRRAVDLLIAASAVASGLALYTLNPEDFTALEGLVDVRTVPAASRP